MLINFFLLYPLTNIKINNGNEKKFFTWHHVICSCRRAMQAQTPEAGGELRALLPDGVKANIGTERRPF